MRRVVSVWLPTLSTDRIRRHAGYPPEAIPLVTTAHRNNANVIAAVDRTASEAGVRPGMGLVDARLRVPNLVVQDADPPGDGEALTRLAEACLRYAPLVGVDPPDGLWIDITGATHPYGDETGLLRDLLGRLNAEGWAARAAAADRPAVAHALARFAAEPIGAGSRDGHDPAPNLNDFPLEALRLPSAMIAELRKLGFERIGWLDAMPRASLTRRFGPFLLTRLDQLAARVSEPIVPIVPRERPQARLDFAEPLLTAEAFSSAIARLAVEVCGWLERAGLGARRLDLLFGRVDGSVAAIRIGTARPVRDPHHLGRLLRERLDQLDPGLGVEAMRLVIASADPLGAMQPVAALIPTGLGLDPCPSAMPARSPVMPQADAFHSLPAMPPDDRPVLRTAGVIQADAAPADVVFLVDRLVNRLGRQRVYRLQPVASHVPERSVRRVAALAPFLHQIWPPDWPRPVRILHPPQPIEAMTLHPDLPPTAFIWRRIRYSLRRTDGPERIAGEWWRGEREMMSIRDYFLAEDEAGRRFWLFRRNIRSRTRPGEQGWFLHGFF